MKTQAALTLLISALTACCYAQSAQAQQNASTAPACTWESVGAKYNINPALLYAIAKTESGLNPKAVGRNTNGSYDIGMMQINSSWLPTLAKHGITERHLYDPCVSLDVGAWVLAQNMSKLGNSWNAVGAYNAVTPSKRVTYAQKVYRNIPAPYLANRE